jgi:hypothetical protein
MRHLYRTKSHDEASIYKAQRGLQNSLPGDNQVGLPKPLARDRVDPAKAVATLDLALLKAEIECRIYKRPIEDIAKDFPYEPLQGEVRAVIIAAWQRGGMLPRRRLLSN